MPCCCSWALQRYAVDLLIGEGFTATTTPDLARDVILEGTGFMPARPRPPGRFRSPTAISALVATARVTLGGAFHERIFEADELPLALCGISHCFRTEAGAAWPGHPRPVPRAPVHEGGDVRLHDARASGGDARQAARSRMPALRWPGDPVSADRHGLGRPGRAGLPEIRPRGLDAGLRRKANGAR